jgi:hypothetical protein
VPDPAIGDAGLSDAAARRAVDTALVAVALAALVAALAGLPLFEDGAFYFYKLLVTGAPEVPALRYAAVLPQLPAAVANWLDADVTILRHVFSLSYAALPVLSLIGCWLVVRGPAPGLILFPALFLVVNQINYSAVSELLWSLHLAWPFVLLAAVRPASRLTLVYGLALGALLPLLHPMAFLLLFALSGLAWLVAVLGGPASRGRYRALSVWLAAAGALRLVWTGLAATSYERAHFGSSGAAHYLFPPTDAQALLMLIVLALGAVWAWVWLARVQTLRAGAGDGGGHPSVPGAAILRMGVWTLPVLAVVLGFEWLAGAGIKLKIGLVFPVALSLMGLAAVCGLSVRRWSNAPVDSRWARAFAVCALAILLMTLAKSSAWWTATRGLITVTADAEQTCVEFGPEQPPGLQWPWMAIIDNWTTPLAALVYRAPGPVPLLLPGDGCARLATTGVAHLDSWIQRPFNVLTDTFGPLRAPAAE